MKIWEVCIIEETIMSNQPAGKPRIDLAKEGRRVIDAATEAGFPVRAIGGLAVKLRCPAAKHRSLQREYGDLDFVTYSDHALELLELMENLQYKAMERFNALYGAYRLLFEDLGSGLKCDVFVDHFEMCHKCSFVGRLELDDYTIPLSDLLLTKLQVVELCEKDLLDIYSLLLSYDLTAGPSKEGIDAAHIARVCGADWGWYRTVRGNLDRVLALSSDYLSANECDLLAERITRLIEMIEGAPKSRSWRLRSLVGDRVRWYQLPEEVTTERPV